MESAASSADAIVSEPQLPQVEPEDAGPIFKRMALRRIIKENHGADINQCAFFIHPLRSARPDAVGHAAPALGENVLATVGGAQASFYDNEHCGDHLDIMSQFTIEDDPTCTDTIPKADQQSETSNEMLTCCWLRFPQDAVLAAAGRDKKIHILSIANSAELMILEGHTVRGAGSNWCRFDVTRDEMYFCVGTSVGTVSIYSLVTGKLISELKHKRSAKAVRCCAFSHNNR
eukprot:jgi/Hompol1/74/HPOL_004284-RA